MIIKQVQRYGQLGLSKALWPHKNGLVTMRPTTEGILLLRFVMGDEYEPETYVTKISHNYRVNLPIKYRRKYNIQSAVEIVRLAGEQLLIQYHQA